MTAVAQQSLFGPAEAPEPVRKPRVRRAAEAAPTEPLSEPSGPPEAPAEDPDDADAEGVEDDEEGDDGPSPGDPDDPTPPPADDQPTVPGRAAGAVPMRTRLYRLKHANLKDLVPLLARAHKAYAAKPTVAKLDAILRLQREIRALTSELEGSLGPDDIMTSVMGILNLQTEELLKSVSDDFVLLRDQLHRGANPSVAVDEAFKRVGSRVVEAHRANKRALDAVLVKPAEPKGPNGAKR